MEQPSQWLAFDVDEVQQTRDGRKTKSPVQPERLKHLYASPSPNTAITVRPAVRPHRGWCRK